MAEVYRVDRPCVLAPPGVSPPSSIDMPVTPVNSPPTPVHRIVAYPPSGTSYEYETSTAARRYADIFFTSSQFTVLRNNVNVRTLWISYDAPAIPGNDRISHQTVLLNYP